jgi:hypothetical protein
MSKSKPSHHESSPKHPTKLIEIECPECYHIKYGENAMIDHLIYGEQWSEHAAVGFVTAHLEFLRSQR